MDSHDAAVVSAAGCVTFYPNGIERWEEVAGRRSQVDKEFRVSGFGFRVGEEVAATTVSSILLF